MLPLIRLHLSLITLIITIGITPVIIQQTTPVGPPHQTISQFTTHVQPVGASLMEVVGVWVYGQMQDLMILHTTVQMEEYLSASHLLQKLGILLQVIATAMMAVSTVSVTSAAIGLHLLTIMTDATSTACPSSTTTATSTRRTATTARTVYLSVVSKNNS